MREVVTIDIANDPIQSGDYKPHEDPSKFKSQKTNRGPLVGKWHDAVSLRPISLLISWQHNLKLISFILIRAGSAGHDLLQVSYRRIQMVWPSNACRELYHES
jgi:Phosphatidylinositol transfer protein